MHSAFGITGKMEFSETFIVGHFVWSQGSNFTLKHNRNIFEQVLKIHLQTDFLFDIMTKQKEVSFSDLKICKTSPMGLQIRKQAEFFYLVKLFIIDNNEGE